MNHPYSDNAQIQVVTHFSELINTQFKAQVNALCWHRDLNGNFAEIVLKLQLQDNITEVSIKDLLALDLTEQGHIARQTIIQDITLLSDYGASPSLNLIKNYERDDELDFISTDVYSYHVDRSPIATDTFLCTYYGAASDIIANDQVEQKIQIPEIREKLKAVHDDFHKKLDGDFESFLAEYYFDLHYQPKPQAKPTNLGIGHLWRLAVDHPTQQVLPCVHRAPVENNEFRLLLIC
ncbi:DUF1826 domain-containing protein [Acinetobacter shaoyimingii]|uniref:DUF1826 domain-containing protein n=1 Tax=Acinetobacter shaoyimingii TaxID=2715164 RepID=A0A6G8RVG1_9GAMM|nr:DUF1826 domain-containing protein [Acinetobacter shaoyimingii]QIO05867.1 DUF1826 domain-containing protein [Acinetobacter shaoyimingii]